MSGRASVYAVYVAQTEERAMAETHECQPPQADSYHEASWQCDVCGKRWVTKPYHREAFGSQGTRTTEAIGKGWVEESA
jgi:ribosomal protein L37AE/L43A